MYSNLISLCLSSFLSLVSHLLSSSSGVLHNHGVCNAFLSLLYSSQGFLLEYVRLSFFPDPQLNQGINQLSCLVRSFLESLFDKFITLSYLSLAFLVQVSISHCLHSLLMNLGVNFLVFLTILFLFLSPDFSSFRSPYDFSLLSHHQSTGFNNQTLICNYLSFMLFTHKVVHLS